MRVAVILALALLLFSGLSFYVYRRLAGAFLLPRWSKLAVSALVLATPISAVLPRFYPRLVGELAPFLGAFAAMVVLSVLISAALLLPYELARAVMWVGSRLRRRRAASAPLPAQPQPAAASPVAVPSAEAQAAAASALSRRSFVQRAAVGGAVGLGVGSTVYGTLLGRHDYTLETVPIKLSKLPRALDGFRIVQLSDIHVGSFVGDYELARGVELVRRAKPDLVVLTGDLIDHDIRYVERLGRFARALTPYAPHGLFAVMGNHDHYTGVHQVERVLGKAGAQVLTNRHVRVGEPGHRFVLAGLDDVVGDTFSGDGRGPDLKRTLAGARTEHEAVVMLSHNPGYYPISHAHADLTLSGHTHGGQITLFINPAQLVLRHGFVRGLYAHGDSQLYVNRGFGTAGPPTRIGSPPEVSCLVLTS